jgi:hypothetical protein
VGAASFAALAFVSAAVAASKPPSFANKTIVFGKSVGGLVLGASAATAKRVFPASDCDASGCQYFTQKNDRNGIQVQFGGPGSRSIVTIQLYGLTPATKPLKTTKGIGMGSTEAHFRAAYPRVLINGAEGLSSVNASTQSEFFFPGGKLAVLQIADCHAGRASSCVT